MSKQTLVPPAKTVKAILTNHYLHELVSEVRAGRMRWFVIRSQKLL